jgi:SAM-dependent methyltransferase
MAACKGPCHAAPVPENYFDERIAKTYEAKWPELFEPAVVDPVVRFLADLAGTGAALELGIGTGRIAIPLSQRGVRGHGIDLSPRHGRPAPGQAGQRRHRRDHRRLRHHQRGRDVRARLPRAQHDHEPDDPGRAGRLLPERRRTPGAGRVLRDRSQVPELQRLPPGETVRAFTLAPTHLGFDEYEVATQGLTSHHYWVADGQLEPRSTPFRYVWPSELDLMARLAGMSLRERWSGWTRASFTSDSRQHVSVWEKTA